MGGSGIKQHGRLGGSLHNGMRQANSKYATYNPIRHRLCFEESESPPGSQSLPPIHVETMNWSTNLVS